MPLTWNGAEAYCGSLGSGINLTSTKQVHKIVYVGGGGGRRGGGCAQVLQQAAPKLCWSPQGTRSLLQAAIALASGASVWGGGYRTGTDRPNSGWVWVDGTSADNLNCQPLGCPNGDLWASNQPEYVRCRHYVVRPLALCRLDRGPHVQSLGRHCLRWVGPFAPVIAQSTTWLTEGLHRTREGQLHYPSQRRLDN
jgi:hypothetical protein